MKPQNFKLSNNITFYEYMEGQLPALARQWNWESYNKLSEQEKIAFIQRAIAIAGEVQKERDYLNQYFKKENEGKEIRITISCGYRCVKWELYRDRSGKGQHPIAAIDFVVSNCPVEFSSKMHKDIFDRRYKTWLGGFAIKYPTLKNKTMVTSGFIHIDNRLPNREEKQRGYGTRWTY
jgi:hypothetical protein